MNTPSSLKFPPETIVVPIDFSEHSFAALDVALQMAKDPARVHIIHVLPVLLVAEPGVVWDTIDNESRVQHAIAEMEHRLIDGQYADIQIHVEIGDRGERVAEFAESVNADMIVMPSHGRSGLKRLLIGSVTERVLRLAHCPVLVLRS